jgi:hypothetical protein
MVEREGGWGWSGRGWEKRGRRGKGMMIGGKRGRKKGKTN